MEDFPKNLLEFEQRFATEEACRDYFLKLRWPHGFRCPGCESQKAWLTDRNLYHCENCGIQTSLFAGTIFQDTKKPLQLWFNAIWHITNQKYGANALGLQRILGFGSYRTAWTWLHKLRRAMVRPGRDRLSGTIEVDETFIGGEKSGKRGRGATGKELVVIAVQKDGRKLGRIRLQRVPNASGNSLENVIQNHIEPGSIIQTDGWQGYNGLGKLGYFHEVVRKDTDVGDNLLPKAHLVASLLKRWLLGTYQGAVRPAHLDFYLDEYTFRFNRRTSRSRGKLFYRLLQQAAEIRPVTIHEIHKKKLGQTTIFNK
jgi:transposase-like protein